MIRHAAAVAIALCLSPSWLYAQTTVWTVKTVSADVHLSPSTGSPVVGHARNGTVLEVTRELGSWVKVSWPGAQDGAGYVHVSTGVLGRGSASASGPAAGLTSAQPAAQPAPSQLPIPVERRVSGGSLAPMRAVYVTPSTHIIGLGGHVGGSSLGLGGSNVGFGATARAWSHDRIGLQLELSRYAHAAAETGRLTSLQFEPSVLYSLPDYVTDYVWFRPYLGSGVNLRHQTLSSSTPGAVTSLSENKFGLQFFGGGELTFAGVPRFALSLDLGYHRARTSFVGVDLGGLGTTVSGHWYVK